MLPAALTARALVPTFSACAGLLLGALIGSPQAGFAQTPAKGDTTGDAKVQLLFVQNGTGVIFDTAKGTLRLKNVAPSTLYFSDRPVRLAGHLQTREQFLPLWGETPDSFVKDPPNATVSMFEAGKQDLVNVVVKLERPRMEGNDLIYKITVLDGKPPKSAGATALFIDVLGFWRRRFAPPVVVVASVPASSATAQANAAASSANMAAASANAAAVPAVAAPPAPSSSDAKLAELKSLLNQGFITQAQYDQFSQRVIDQLLALQ